MAHANEDDDGDNHDPTNIHDNVDKGANGPLVEGDDDDKNLKKLDANKHFKEEKSHGSKKRGELHEYVTATLGAGNMREAVKLPKGEDQNEWLATNTVDFFNEISLLYGIITEYCTKESCPVMSAGPKYEYLWMDGVKIKKPIKVSAPEYIDYLMTWVEEQINDQRYFPVEDGIAFPKNFKQIVKTILKRLFRVYGHMYHSHMQKIIALDAEAHLNSCFKHFIYFVKEFKLVDDRELAPLQDTINHMLKKDAEKQGVKYKPKYQY
jgi:MOB kinase activator 1